MSNTTDSNLNEQVDREEEITIFDLWNIVWKRKWVWLTLGPIFGVLGILYAKSQIDIYQAEVLLAPNAEEQSSGGFSSIAGQFSGFASMAGVNLSRSRDTATTIAILHSRKFLTPFLTEDQTLKTLFKGQWDENSKQWTVSNSRRGSDNRPTDLEAYEKFTRGCLSVVENKKTGLVRISIQFTDPIIAAEWANKLVSNLNEHMRTSAQAASENNLSYLNKQLQTTKILEIREALYSLIESETQTAMLANAKEEFAFKIIDPAIPPERRYKPNRMLIVVAFGFIGGFLGIILCFILHFIKTAKSRTHS